MGCCHSEDSNEGRDIHLRQNLVDGQTRKRPAITSEIQQLSSKYDHISPSVVKESDNCYACDTVFGITVRMHHCRRCQNIFCYECSSRTSQILLYSMMEFVRVCNRCFSELQAENRYYRDQLPILKTGQKFQVSAFLGLKREEITLKLLEDSRIVIRKSENQAEPLLIRLDRVKSVHAIRSLPTSFTISTSIESHIFHAETPRIQQLWVECLSTAVARSKEPSLKSRVEEERRNKVDDVSRQESSEQRKLVNDDIRSKRRQDRDSLRQKWSIV